MDVQPWYRQPWPWFLIALPATAVVGSLLSATLAIRTSDQVVEADYYKRGLAINDELARRDRAAALGLTAHLTIAGSHAGETVTLRLVGKDAIPPEAVVQMSAAPSGNGDSEVSLALALASRSSDGREAVFRGIWPKDVGTEGHERARYLVVETAVWRLDGDVHIAPGTLTLPPQPLQD